MSVFVAHGNDLVSQRAYRSLEPEAVAPRRRGGRKGLRAGAAGGTTDFTPIAPNSPLTIRIAHVYTGRYPKRSFFGGSSQDMLLCSAIKSYSVFDAAPRAIQFYERKVTAKSARQVPAAFDQGTSLIFYTPAVTDASLTLSLELAFDSFPDELLEKVGGGLQSLAGLPIFLPYAGYLMIGSQLARLAGDFGRAFLEGQAEFTRTETLDFDLPGFDRPEAAFRILAAPSFDVSGLQFSPRKGLVLRSDPSRLYDGEEPYLVISLDGRADDRLADFEPTLASAEMLKRVFGSANKAESAIDLLVDAARLANDARMRREADRIDREIGALQKADGSKEELARLKDRREGLVRSIRSDLLKPPAAAPAPSEREPKVADPAHDLAAAPKAKRAAGLRSKPKRAAAPAAAAASSWRVAGSLLRLREQVNAAHPARSKASDGTIGDAKHASRNSDHNPWVVKDGVGVVTAMDITHDPAGGCDAGTLVASLLASRDRRIKYVIYDSKITSSSPIGSHPAWTTRPYGGANKHTKHFHLSVVDAADRFDDPQSWSV
jgi:hypothetical protein